MIKNDPVLLFNSGVLSLKLFNDPEMSMFFFNKMQNSISPQIAHSNRYIAECLISAGKLNEALIFCRKDSSNFPISVISLYMQLSLENQLGKKKESDISSEKLLNALKHMGLKEKHIPEILKNPYYEHKFVELRNKGE